jgi:hypothetical protein
VGLQLPAELISLLGMLGFNWPEADETKLFEMGQRWLAFSGTLQEIGGTSEAAASQVWMVNQGRDVTAFQDHWRGEDGPQPVLRDGSTAATLVGAGLMICGGIVLALKVNVIIQLAILAFQIAQAIATAVATLGASLAEIPIFKEITRFILDTLIDQVINILLSA